MKLAICTDVYGNLPFAEMLDKAAAGFEAADPIAVALKNSATEQRETAIALYKADDSAGRHGSLLRAQALSK